MNIISSVLSKKRDSRSCALIPFIIAGYPSLDVTVEALHLLDKRGADIIELGIPYADALADGPLIQNASKAALNQGTYIDQVLKILEMVDGGIKAPIIIFTYYNPVLVRGVEKFIKEIAFLGAKGLIIPDLPVEETDYLISVCSYYDIELVLFIAPNSSNHRINKILSKSPGCLYIVSSKGVTGIRDSIDTKLKTLFEDIKNRTNKLTMLGFGISTSEQVSIISKWNVDGIVMGSSFIKILSKANDFSDVQMLDRLGHFCYTMKSSI
uniref:Tryptophan synthase alpha chain n=1 Tax=Caloglossa intermedia TaxID=100879 RepID=A0A1Z1M6K9_9FLOR|nr:Tryptophan synthase alpha subunit [Caloglossa intermedia]ARW61394.1 Tryptophan synthase alpha subunit [Caloglossa intermedia]